MRGMRTTLLLAVLAIGPDVAQAASKAVPPKSVPTLAIPERLSPIATWAAPEPAIWAPAAASSLAAPARDALSEYRTAASRLSDARNASDKERSALAKKRDAALRKAIAALAGVERGAREEMTYGVLLMRGAALRPPAGTIEDGLAGVRRGAAEAAGTPDAAEAQAVLAQALRQAGLAGEAVDVYAAVLAAMPAPKDDSDKWKRDELRVQQVRALAEAGRAPDAAALIRIPMSGSASDSEKLESAWIGFLGGDCELIAKSAYALWRGMWNASWGGLALNDWIHALAAMHRECSSRRGPQPEPGPSMQQVFESAIDELPESEQHAAMSRYGRLSEHIVAGVQDAEKVATDAAELARTDPVAALLRTCFVEVVRTRSPDGSAAVAVTARVAAGKLVEAHDIQAKRAWRLEADLRACVERRGTVVPALEGADAAWVLTPTRP